MKFQIGERVVILIPFGDGESQEGTVRFISPYGEYPYLVSVGKIRGSYSSEELAPATTKALAHFYRFIAKLTYWNQ